MAPREEQRGLAARARGGRRVRGGAAALRRRRPRIRVGNRSKSMSRPRGNSPGIDLGRRMAGRWSLTRGAKLGAELDEDSNGGRRSELDFGRGRARSRLWVVGVVGWRGCAARGATNRGGAASRGRCDERRRLCSTQVARARGWGWKRRTGRGRKVRGRPRGEERCSLAMADAWKLAAGHSRRYGVGASQ